MDLVNWKKALVWECKGLIERRYYSVGTAMGKIWDRNYSRISCSVEIDVEELRFLFWSEGFDELEDFEKEIIDRYERD